MVWFLAFFLSLPAARWPVESLAVDGNRNYTAEQVLAVAGIKKGQLAGKADFDAARERLMATGAFENVGYRFAPSASGKGYAASFQVAEVEQVYPYRFERIDAPPAELEAALKRSDPLFGGKIPATQPVLDRYVKVLEAYLASRNKAEKLAGRLTADAPEQLVVLFSPAAAPPSVAAVSFVNNSAIPTGALRNAIAGAAVGSVYTEERFRQILELSVRPLYEALGRIQVSFPSLRTGPAEDVNGLLVTVEVAEGDVFSLGEVRFDGAALPLEEMRKAGDFKTGEAANFTEIQEGIERIKKRFRRAGYMQPEASVERQVHDKGKTVDLLVRFREGVRYVFGELKVQGLDIHGEAAIRRLWTLKPGAPFNADYPDYFLQRIREDGVFDNLRKTRPVLDIHEQDRAVDVTLVF